MYYGAPGFDMIFTRETFIAFVIMFLLAFWKVVDIIIWLVSHVKVSWV